MTTTAMLAHLFVALQMLALSAVGQSNIYTLRVVASHPGYECIFFPKGSTLRPPTLRGVDDLSPAERYGGTNRVDGRFTDPSRERTNGFYISCSTEVPLASLALRCPGDLLDVEQVRELLRDTVAVPRTVWTNHVYRYNSGDRYVFSLAGRKGEEYVIDERPGAFALLFFPDGTYRCLVGPGYWFLPPLQAGGAANRSQRGPPETNRASAAAGSDR